VFKIPTETFEEEELLTPPITIEETGYRPALIIHGAGGTKVGFGGEKYPRFVYPEQSTDLKTRIRRFPIEGDKPTNETLLHAYWEASIKNLRINPVENPILLSLPTADLTNDDFRKLLEAYFFEELGANQVAFISDPFLSLVNFIPQTKSLTAVLVDIGLSQIRIVPFYEASILEGHIVQTSFGGFELTLQLGTWFKQQGYEGPIDALFIRDIKENYCYVRSLEKYSPQKSGKAISYYFNKQIFELADQRWKLPELFFYKKFFSEKTIECPRSDFEGNRFNLKELTLSRAIAFVIQSLNERLCDTFCKNICLTGGGAKFIGLKERLQTELEKLLPECKNKLQIYTTKEPSLSSFIGASRLSLLPAFQKQWITQEQYSTGKYNLFL